MEEQSQRPSRIPSHLRPFLRAALTPELLATQAPYSYTPHSKPSTIRSVELSPPHWRLKPKRNVRDTLKTILLKDCRVQTVRSRARASPRSVIMRMKNSDDYITARAANPWTGMISPSVGSPSPDQVAAHDSLYTPPGALSTSQPPSPTPASRSRPYLKRAMGEKATGAAFREPANGWVAGPSLASPRVTATSVGAAAEKVGGQPINGDEFVVHMPSAREPQPFAYPGCSAKQIAAFEHYKHKTRQVSAEGYDRRLLDVGCQVSSAAGKEEALLIRCAGGWPEVIPATNGQAGGIQDEYCHAGAQLDATTFAPFSSPKTPAFPAKEPTQTVLQTVPRPAPAPVATVPPMPRKPIALTKPSQKQELFPDFGDLSRSGAGTASSSPPVPEHSLASLPRVRLVHPTQASVPHKPLTGARPGSTGIRQCSLGCARDVNTDACLQTRTVHHAETITTTPSLFSDGKKTGSNGPVQKYMTDVIVTILLVAVDLSKAMHLPRIPALDILRAEDASQEQKIEALKVIFTFAGQTVLLCTFVAGFLQVGAGVASGVRILLWSLLLPLRLGRWLVG